MIFSCPRCSTRYKLADDRVVNRLVKVRCTKCGVVIVVRDPALATDRSDVKPPSLPPQDVWFAAISGQQHGPVSLAGMKALIDRKAINSLSYVWKQGMPEWLRAGVVDELKSLFPKETIQTQAPVDDESPTRTDTDEAAVATVQQQSTTSAGEDGAAETQIVDVEEDAPEISEEVTRPGQVAITDEEGEEPSSESADAPDGQETVSTPVSEGEDQEDETERAEDGGDQEEAAGGSDDVIPEPEEQAAPTETAVDFQAEGDDDTAAAPEMLDGSHLQESPEVSAPEEATPEEEVPEAAPEEATPEEEVPEAAPEEEEVPEEVPEATPEEVPEAAPEEEEVPEEVPEATPEEVPEAAPEDEAPEDEADVEAGESKPASDEPPPVPEPSEVSEIEAISAVDAEIAETEDEGPEGAKETSSSETGTDEHEAAAEPESSGEADPDDSGAVADEEAPSEAETVEHEAAPEPSSSAETVENEAAPDSSPEVETIEQAAVGDEHGLLSEETDVDAKEADDEGGALDEEALHQDAFTPIGSDPSDLSGYEDTLLATDRVLSELLPEGDEPQGEELPYAETLLATEQVVADLPGADVADPGAETLLVTEQVVLEGDAPDDESSDPPADDTTDEGDVLPPEAEFEDEATVIEIDGSDDEMEAGAETQLVPEQFAGDEAAGEKGGDGEPSTRETLEPEDLGKLVDAEHPDDASENGDVDLLPLPPDQEALLDERQQGEVSQDVADDLFAAVDEGRPAPVAPSAPEPEGEDKGFFKKAMRGAPRLQSLTHIEAPTSAEMKEIRQEFSVVARLEHSKKKTQLLIFAILGLLAGAVVAGFFLFEEQSARKKATAEEAFNTSSDNLPTVSRKARYESQVPDAVPEPEEPEEPIAVEPAPIAPVPTPVLPKTGTQPKKKFKKLSAAQMALLQQDDMPSTPKLKKMDPGAEARKAAEKKAKERRTQMSSARTEKVVETFARKRRQLARCKGEEEEKVKVIFTIGSNGRVTDVKVKGAEDPEKSKCIEEILNRAIFPAGAETETFSMPVTL